MSLILDYNAKFPANSEAVVNVDRVGIQYDRRYIVGIPITKDVNETITSITFNIDLEWKDNNSDSYPYSPRNSWYVGLLDTKYESTTSLGVGEEVIAAFENTNELAGFDVPSAGIYTVTLDNIYWTGDQTTKYVYIFNNRPYFASGTNDHNYNRSVWGLNDVSISSHSTEESDPFKLRVGLIGLAGVVNGANSSSLAYKNNNQYIGRGDGATRYSNVIKFYMPDFPNLEKLQFDFKISSTNYGSTYNLGWAIATSDINQKNYYTVGAVTDEYQIASGTILVPGEGIHTYEFNVPITAPGLYYLYLWSYDSSTSFGTMAGLNYHKLTAIGKKNIDIKISFDPKNSNSIVEKTFTGTGEEFNIVFPNDLNIENENAIGLKGWQLCDINEIPINSMLYNSNDTVKISNINCHFIAIWDKIKVYANMGNEEVKSIECESLEPDISNNYSYYLNLDGIEPTNLPDNQIFDNWNENTGYYTASEIYGGYKLIPNLSSCFLITLLDEKDETIKSKIKPNESYTFPSGTDFISRENLAILTINPNNGEEKIQNFENGLIKTSKVISWSNEDENISFTPFTTIQIEQNYTLTAKREEVEQVEEDLTVRDLTLFDFNKQYAWKINEELISMNEPLKLNTVYTAVIYAAIFTFKDYDGTLLETIKLEENTEYYDLSNITYTLPPEKEEDLICWVEMLDDNKEEIIFPKSQKIKVINFIGWNNYNPDSIVTIIQDTDFIAKVDFEIEINKSIEDLLNSLSLINEENVTFKIIYKNYLDKGFELTGEENNEGYGTKYYTYNILLNNVLQPLNTLIQNNQTYKLEQKILSYEVSSEIEILDLIKNNTNSDLKFNGWSSNGTVVTHQPGNFYEGPNNLILYALYNIATTPIFYKQKKQWIPKSIKIKTEDNQWI